MITSLFSEYHGLDVVDFHSHILPGADHGSYTVETSLAQLRSAQKNSVKRILATPHFYPNLHTISYFIANRSSAIAALKAAKTPDMPEFKVGAEVLLCEGLERHPELDRLCFDGTKHIMIELPFVDVSDEHVKTLEALMDKGYNVILAHVDRYPKEYIEELIELGVKNLQVNVSSLATVFKRKHLYKWAEKGLVTMLGSDIHGDAPIAYKYFANAQKKLSNYILQIKASSDKIWDEIKSI